MNSLQPTSLPLDYAAEIVFELGQLRDECVNVAQKITTNAPLNEVALDECARLDDALAVAQRVLQSALISIRRSRQASGGR